MSGTVKLVTDACTVMLRMEEDPLTRALLEALPVQSRVSTWGGEIYCPVPISGKATDPTREVTVGDVAYWPAGEALAVFFGPTPLSENDRPVPADPVQRLGRVKGDPSQLDKVEAGARVSLEPA